MNYPTMARIARVAAIIAAIIAAFGATMGFYEMTGNIIVSALIGIGVASLLGFGWHLTISSAEHARRGLNRWALVLVGMMLVGVAVATSGWTMVTLIGGKSALSQYQIVALEEHELGLAEAMSRVNGQRDLVDNVRQHAAATELLGDEEGRSGKGPLFRSYTRTAENLRTAANTMEATIETADIAYAQGLEALGMAQKSLGETNTFRDALSDVTASIVSLNAINVSAGMLNIGMVGLNDKQLPELTSMTQSLRDAAKASEVEPVTVPHYRSISRSEAVLMVPVVGAWMAAIAVDAAPFIFLLLVLMLVNEPLLREPANRRRTSDDEIRVAEDNVIGLKGVAE